MGNVTKEYLIKQLKNHESQVLDKKYLRKVSELPTASSVWLDDLFLLTADQTGYFKGGIYQCVSDGAQSPTYSWELISGSNEYYGTEEEWEALSTEEQNRYDFIRTHGDEEIIQLGKYLEKVTFLPTATADIVNKVVLLVGTQSGYQTGGHYKCVSNGGDPATYSWQLIGFDPTTLGTASLKNSTDRVSPNNRDLVESQSVYSAINTALSSIYTPAGDITCAKLTSALLIEANVGKVYELSDAGTTTDLFLQGAGKPLAIGDNVGIINAGQGRILFNLMANRIDLSTFQKKDLTSPVESATSVEGALSALSSNKVAKETGKGLSTNDYTNADKAIVDGVTSALAGKVDKVTGKGLSTNDYDNTEKAAVANSVQKSNTAGLLKNDGTVDTTAYAKQSEMSITDGTGADAGTSTIQLKTGTSKKVLTAHQDISGKLEKVTELPTPTAELEDTVYLLVEPQTGFKEGCTYKCTEVSPATDPATYYWRPISSANYTGGAGITIDNDKINADTNIFPGTVDEYEALSADEKKQYSHIADEDSADCGKDVYSTTEVKTNKVWIDGKPIYRKVLTYATARTSGQTVQVGSVSDIDMATSLNIFYKSSSGVFAYAERYSSSSDSMLMWIQNGGIYFRQYQEAAVYLSAPLYIIIEYTKTTD